MTFASNFHVEKHSYGEGDWNGQRWRRPAVRLPSMRRGEEVHELGRGDHRGSLQAIRLYDESALRLHLPLCHGRVETVRWLRANMRKRERCGHKTRLNAIARLSRARRATRTVQ